MRPSLLALLLAAPLACAPEPAAEDDAGTSEGEPGSLCACRELDEGSVECCFGHGACTAQDQGPDRCACDPGARGETCSTPAPGLQPVRARDCEGADPSCAQTHLHVVVEHFDACVDLGGETFASTIVRPSTAAGAWPEQGSPWPVAVLTHGASQDPADYYDLLEHLAAQGIVAAAFDSTKGEDPTFRANRLLSYLECLRGQWPEAARLDDRYALIGHSRGGTAVAIAAEAIAEGLAAPGLEVVAVVALAPTKTGQFALSSAATPAYLALEGSRDPEVQGASLGWFDQAGQGEPSFVRSHAWVFGATHQRFHQGLLFSGSGELQATLSSEQHWALARAYIGGFLAWRLLGRDELRALFEGRELPASLAELALFTSLGDGSGGRVIVHDFEGPSLSPSPLGGEVVELGGALELGPLAELDAPWSAAHRSGGLRLDWDAGQAAGLRFELPPASLDASAHAVFSLRLGRVFDDPTDCGEAPAQLAELSLVFVDDVGEVALPLAELGRAGDVPAPDRMIPETFGNWTTPACQARDALRTVRVPVQLLCARGLDPSQLRAIELRVDNDNSGGALLLDELFFELGEGEVPGCG